MDTPVAQSHVDALGKMRAVAATCAAIDARNDDDVSSRLFFKAVLIQDLVTRALPLPARRTHRAPNIAV